MTAFTERQRQVLEDRLARGIVWHHAQQYERDNARLLARRLVADLDGSPANDRAARRGLRTVIENLEAAS